MEDRIEQRCLQIMTGLSGMLVATTKEIPASMVAVNQGVGAADWQQTASGHADCVSV